MKNIHVLPTENESRLRYNSFNKVYELCEFPKYHPDIKSTHNIYITSDAEIKEGDWFMTDDRRIEKSALDWQNREWHYKIILTTDQDLIKDDVQAVDDEFLNWFVKNPSCDSVLVEYNEYEIFGNKSKKWIDSHSCYKIIIPKEEDFKHELHVMSKEEVIANRSNAYEFIDFDKQEILEELAIQKRNELGLKGTIDGFIAGFEIAKERMYSDEEVSELVDMLQKCKEYFLLKTDLKSEERADAIGQVLEQFKKNKV